MSRKEIEEIHFNGMMMEHESDALLERVTALDEAAKAIGEGYVADQPEDFVAPVDFDHAVNYVTGLLYRMGSAAPNRSDARTSLERDLEWTHGKETDDWQPETPEQLQLVEDLLVKASFLAIDDKEPAYSSHVDGRNHETLDLYDTKYNKFGTIVYPRAADIE